MSPVHRALRRAHVVSLVVVLAALAAGACSRAFVRQPPPAAPAIGGEPLSAFYLVGDFGRPQQPFRDLVAALAYDADQLAALDLRTAPMILELGDNLYEEGIPHDLADPGATAEVDKLRAIAEGFAQVRYDGAQVPLVLIPGNHDYANNALVNEGNRGDISRWYFLEELGIAGAASWVHIPGDAAGYADAAALYDHLDGDPGAHAAFMAPATVPFLDRDVGIAAIDSELLLDLYAAGHDDLAAQYWERLEQALAEMRPSQWRLLATHHPPVTYGKHGAPSLGNWLFGQGWPQFPKGWQKALAAAMPLGIVTGVLIYPAALAISAAPPVSTAVLAGRKQDVGSTPYERYTAELLRIAAAHDVDAIFSGHDHNIQIIELGELDGFDDDTLLVISGAGSKNDPVRRGPGTAAYLSDYAWIRVTQYAGGLSFDVIDRRGRGRARYDLLR
ncbi:MAG: metallophosphoesterase [Acidobacteriota bacterium]